MFRKLISNIAFSPALVGQLSFYSKRLRQEELTRRLGLIFTAFALMIQSLVVFSPPEAVNASSNADFVRGGVTDVADFLRYYDRNNNNIKSVLDSLGIKRSEIAAAKPTVIGEASRYNWSMTSLYSYAQGQRTWNYGGGNVFYRPMHLTQEGGDRHPVFASYSESIGWFAIKKDCGNLITEKEPQPLEPVAECVNLSVTPLSQKRFRFSGKASKEDGADLFSYVYRVFNDDNKKVDEIVSKTGKQSDSVVYTHSGEPGKYTVKLLIRASTGLEKDKNCMDRFTVAEKPSAECKAVKAFIKNRTLVSLTGSAIAQNGAKINAYTFVVRDSSGTEVKRLRIDSDKLSETAPVFELNKVGTYNVKLIVRTSTGVQTNDTSCQKQFTITPEDVCPYNSSLPISHPDCQPCPDSPDLWIKDEQCNAIVVSNKAARNLTQGSVDATTIVASASDKINYTLSVENTGLASTTIDIKEELGDVLEYANLIDGGGGTFDETNKQLTWTGIALKAGEKQSRTFVIQLMEHIPLTNTGTSDESSYDCTMVNTYGNNIEINVACPPSKEVVESTVTELPQTGPGENIAFGGTLLTIVAYFYARSRQLGKEVRLIRKNVNAGAF